MERTDWDALADTPSDADAPGNDGHGPALATAIERLTPVPAGFDPEVPHDGPPPIRTERDRERAVLGLSEWSRYPRVCDLCGDEAPAAAGVAKVVHGRWWVHEACLEEGLRLKLSTLALPPREWAWGLPARGTSPLACSVAQHHVADWLMREQTAEVVRLRVWKLTQAQIAERLGVT
jgi:hypothetical protein